MIEQRIVVALANSVWQSALLGLLSAVLLRLSGRTSANTRYVVWMATLSVCVLLPAVDFGFTQATTEAAALSSAAYHLSGAASEPPAPRQHLFAPRLRHYAVFGQRLRAGLSASHVMFRRLQSVVKPPRPLPPWAKPGVWAATLAQFAFKTNQWLFWSWIFIANLLIARLIIDLISLSHAKRRVTIMNEFDWIGQCPGARRPYSVGISDGLQIPCLLGLSKPIIAIPRAIVNELSGNDLRRIVLHESAHVRRYDDWFHLLEQCILALLFFNPALYFLTRALHLEREIACDDQVVATDERLFYAECLSLLAGRAHSGRASFAPSFLSGRREILIRIQELLDRRHVVSPRLGIVPYAIATGLVIVALALCQTGIPVLAAPMHTADTITQTPTQKHFAARVLGPHTPPQPLTKARPHPMIQVIVAVAVPAVGPTAQQARPSPAARASSQTRQKASQHRVLVIDNEAKCTVSFSTQTAPKADGMMGSYPLEISSTASASVGASPPCPAGPTVKAGVGHQPIGIEHTTKVILICNAPGSRILPHTSLSADDIKALKASGCTLGKPIENQKMYVAWLPDVNMKAMQSELERANAELEHSMKSVWVPTTVDFSKYDAELRGLAKSQAQVGVAIAQQNAVELPRLMAEMQSTEFGGWGAPLPQLPVKEITEMRQHGVTGEYISSLSRVGYADLSAADYIRLHDHGITAECIVSLRRAYPGSSFSVDDLLKLPHSADNQPICR